MVLSCGAPGSRAAPRSHHGPAARFRFGDLEGQVQAAENYRGRVSVLLFATTYDVASQAQARRLNEFLRGASPRINALLVMLEPPKNADLVRAFRAFLDLRYPVVLADGMTLKDSSDFGEVTSVPFWVVLRQDGSVSSAFAGALSAEQLAAAVDAASR